MKEKSASNDDVPSLLVWVLTVILLITKLIAAAATTTTASTSTTSSTTIAAAASSFRCLLSLGMPQASVEPSQTHQLVVSSAFNDCPCLHH